jgi:hypothetical protein
MPHTGIVAVANPLKLGGVSLPRPFAADQRGLQNMTVPVAARLPTTKRPPTGKP